MDFKTNKPKFGSKMEEKKEKQEKEHESISDKLIKAIKKYHCSWCGGIGHTERTCTAKKHFCRSVSSLGPEWAEMIRRRVKKPTRMSEKTLHPWAAEKSVLEDAAQEAIKTIGHLIQTL